MVFFVVVFLLAVVFLLVVVFFVTGVFLVVAVFFGAGIFLVVGVFFVPGVFATLLFFGGGAGLFLLITLGLAAHVVLCAAIIFIVEWYKLQ